MSDSSSIRAAPHCASGGRSLPSAAPRKNGHGGVAEWLKAHAWRACIRATVSRVRIPLPPPRSTLNQALTGVWTHLSIRQSILPAFTFAETPHRGASETAECFRPKASRAPCPVGSFGFRHSEVKLLHIAHE